MNLEVITQAAGTALTHIVLALLSLAAAYAVYYIRLAAAKAKAQTAKLTDERARAVLDHALDDVERLANKAVGCMEQTTAKALREAVKAGTADRAALVALGKQVFDEIKAAITPDAQRVITENLGSFDAYLTDCIEDAVRKIKCGELSADDTGQ